MNRLLKPGKEKVAYWEVNFGNYKNCWEKAKSRKESAEQFSITCTVNITCQHKPRCFKHCKSSSKNYHNFSNLNDQVYKLKYF